MERILEFQGKYRFLSNFWPSKVVYDDVEYPTIEHAYQAAKTLDRGLRKEVLTKDTPGKAKRWGSTFPDKIRKDWREVNIEIMRGLLFQKFLQDPFFGQLLDTGDAELIEGNNHGDTFWGMCDGVGENHLGRLLMEIRSELEEVSQAVQELTAEYSTEDLEKMFKAVSDDSGNLDIMCGMANDITCNIEEILADLKIHLTDNKS